MICTHDIIAKDNACADGMCPICLAAEVDRLTEESSWLFSESLETMAKIKRLQVALQEIEFHGGPAAVVARAALGLKHGSQDDEQTASFP